MKPLSLAERTPWSFEIVNGTSSELAQWLEAHHFSRKALRNSAIEALRLEAIFRGQRAIVVVFKSGVCLAQGHPGARDWAVHLLHELCTASEPAGEQLALNFDEVQR